MKVVQLHHRTMMLLGSNKSKGLLQSMGEPEDLIDGNGYIHPMGAPEDLNGNGYLHPMGAPEDL